MLLAAGRLLVPMDHGGESRSRDPDGQGIRKIPEHDVAEAILRRGKSIRVTVTLVFIILSVLLIAA